MTTEVKNFSHPEFGKVRAMSIDNEPWFVGKDVAEVLGYAKARNAIASHIDAEDKKEAPIRGPLGGSDVFNVLYAAAAMEVTRNHVNIKKANSLMDYIKKFMEGLKNE